MEPVTTPTAVCRRGPLLAPLVLAAQERSTLQRWARRPSSAHALTLRCRIVLACAEGVSNSQVARQLGVARSTVTKWRARFVADRLDGLVDEPRWTKTVDELLDTIAAYCHRINDSGHSETATGCRWCTSWSTAP